MSNEEKLADLYKELEEYKLIWSHPTRQQLVKEVEEDIKELIKEINSKKRYKNG